MDDNGKKAIISRDTLLPMSLVLLVGGGMFAAGSQWQAMHNRVSINERDIARNSEGIRTNSRDFKLVEMKLEIWRRDLATKGITLPEPAYLDLDSQDKPETSETPTLVAEIAYGVRTHG